MDSDDTWGRPAVAETLSALRPVRDRGGRLSALEEEIAELGSTVLDEPGAEDDPKHELELDRGWFADLSLIVVDAVLARDKKALDAVESLLQRVYRAVAIRQPAERQASGAYESDEVSTWEAWLGSASEYVRSALERVAPVAVATAIAGAHGEHFLRAVAQRPGINSRQVGVALAEARAAHTKRAHGADPGAPERLDEGQVSRLGTKLRAEGLVFAQRGPQGLSWEITPRGTLVLERLLGADAGAESSADHPVGSMVIATDTASMAGVVAALTACAPLNLAILSGDRMSTYERSDPASDSQDAGAGRRASALSFRNAVLEAMQIAGVDTDRHRDSSAVEQVLDRSASEPPTGFALSEDLVYRPVEAVAAGTA